MGSSERKFEVAEWMGKSIREYTKAELLGIINCMALEIERLRMDRDRWRECADPVQYIQMKSA